MARQRSAQQIPLDWPAPCPPEPRPHGTNVNPGTPFTEAEIDELSGLLGDEIDQALDTVMTSWLRQRGAPLTVDAYQDLVETVLYRAVGGTLSLFDDYEYKYCHLTGIDSAVFLQLTEEERNSEAYQAQQGPWAHLPPDYYLEMIPHTEQSPEERISVCRAQWTETTGRSLELAPWES